MKFLNAYIGIKRILISEFFSVLMVIFSVGTLIVSGNGTDLALEELTLSVGAEMAIIGLVIGTLVLVILSAVFSVLGILKASKDDTAFRTSLIFMIISSIAAVLSTVFQMNTAVSQITETVSRVAQLGVTVYIIQGVMDISSKIGEEKMVKKGNHLFVFLLIIYTLMVLADILAMLFQSNTVTMLIAGIFELLASFFNLVQYIMFIIFLFQAHKMLLPYSV